MFFWFEFRASCYTFKTLSVIQIKVNYGCSITKTVTVTKKKSPPKRIRHTTTRPLAEFHIGLVATEIKTGCATLSCKKTIFIPLDLSG